MGGLEGGTPPSWGPYRPFRGAGPEEGRSSPHDGTVLLPDDPDDDGNTDEGQDEVVLRTDGAAALQQQQPSSASLSPLLAVFSLWPSGSGTRSSPEFR